MTTTAVCTGPRIDTVATVRLESDFIRTDIAPSVGGRVVSLLHKPSGQQLLWRNPHLTLRPQAAGAAYDPNFFGGIDELIPNDPPQTLAGADCPDHGELWTLALDSSVRDDRLLLDCVLPRCGIRYQRAMRLENDALICDYTISNPTPRRVPFLWKLHAALVVAEGDRVVCPATRAFPLDLDWTRCATADEFDWPVCGSLDMSTVPPVNGTVEFLCLTNLARGHMALERRSSGVRFCYEFDPAVFSCCWYFASFGGFDGHYVAILEPCTCRGLSVRAADVAGQCTALEPGESLSTTVTTRVGGIGDV